ncbi:MAG TPA: hypothetical protein VFE42_21855 [Chloroflexota bacterium]|nr:hypothetical protein [Chloroflexota bacterium]
MAHTLRWRLAVAAAAAGLAVVPLQRSFVAVAADQGSIHFMGTHDTYLHVRQNANPDLAGNLIYHGGPVMRTNSTTYSIFWQPAGTYMSPTYKTLVNRYFGDVGGSALYGNNTQYYGQLGAIVNASSLGGTWTDTSAYPSAILSDRAIQAEVQKAMQANGWTGGYNNMFFVFLARGEQTCQLGSCSFRSFCAYHGSFSAGGTPVIYANMPYAGTNFSACGVQSVTGSAGPNGDADADSEISIISHEHMESVTDPFVNTLSYAAWYDASGQEIGDKCAWNFGTVGPDGGNVTLNGHRYIVQREWSNALHGCTLG